MKLHLTDKNYRKLITEKMVILVDTREQKNQPYLDVWDASGIRWKRKALKTGDYNFMLEAAPELGWYSHDLYFTDELVIERKNSVDELAGNFANSSKDNGRILREFDRMVKAERAYLLIEDDSLSSILNHEYRSNLNENSFLRSILTVQANNQMVPLFVNREDMPRLIWEICANVVRSKVEVG